MVTNVKYPLSEMHTKASHPLTVILGELINKETCYKSLAAAPHLLIAGATGSGKSVLLDQIALSIMCHTTTKEVGLIIVDPKMLDFASYNGLPHLVSPVITDHKKACEMLEKLTIEMDEKYQFISEYGKKVGRSLRNIDQYNELFPIGDERRMKYIVIIIDEMSDLVMMNPDVDFYIERLGQKGRASGMHLILCTQTPRVDVVTGKIKANIPSRICLSVVSGMESRIILDEEGGEKLAGKGDMLVRWGIGSKLMRLQGAYIDNDMRDRIINYLKAKYEPSEPLEFASIEEVEIDTVSEVPRMDTEEREAIKNKKMDIIDDLLGVETASDKSTEPKKLTMKELLEQRKKGI